MQIYDDPVRVLFQKMIPELVSNPSKQFSKSNAIQWFKNNYPRIKEGTMIAHLMRFSTNAPSRLHYSPKPEEDCLFQIDGSMYRLYDRNLDPHPIHSVEDIAVSRDTIQKPEPLENSSAFSYEKDLQNYLSKNIGMLGKGLKLYQDEGITGIEFPVGGKFVDILAQDADDNLVVIELKVARGYDKVVGQLLRYMAWIRIHQADSGQGVRGIIVGREITDDLKLACSGLSNIELFEYDLSVKLRKIEPVS